MCDFGFPVWSNTVTAPLPIEVLEADSGFMTVRATLVCKKKTENIPRNVSLHVHIEYTYLNQISYIKHQRI